MKTIRRDKLLRLAQAGKLVAVGSYHFDDNSGGEHKKGIRFPVRIQSQHGDFKEGFYNLMEHDFTSHSGCAYLSDDKTAHLHVHGNCSYEFQMADGSDFNGNVKTPTAKRPENARMQAFLMANGLDATPKYIPDGSLRGTWRLYNSAMAWSIDLADKLNSLGFSDFDGNPLGPYSGNGGLFCVFVRGHDELLAEPAVECRQLKVAWIREEGYATGQPAPGKLNCPCRNAPISRFDPSNGNVVCSCGQTYTWDGWKLD